MENTMNTSDKVDRTENVDFEEVTEEKLNRILSNGPTGVREADIWFRYITKHLGRISTSLMIEQLDKDLEDLSIQSQEREEKSDN